VSWRPAPSVKAALAEADRRWPARSRASDGVIGDELHSSRESDHNPDARGIVHAFDLTADPAHGVDCDRLAATLVARRDRRVRYLIWERLIVLGPWSDAVMAGRSVPWQWRPYDGSNPHTKHMHVSVGYNAQPENDTSPWWGEGGGDLSVADAQDILDRLDKMSGQIDDLYRRANHAQADVPTAEAGGDFSRKGLRKDHDALQAALGDLAGRLAAGLPVTLPDAVVLQLAERLAPLVAGKLVIAGFPAYQGTATISIVPTPGEGGA
jgi:hypothetical protein